MTGHVAQEQSGRLRFYTLVFWAAALYDLVLGAVFFFLYDPLFTALEITPPNNASYIHLSAAFVFVQGVGYWFIALNPVRNVDMVKVGAVYKAVYTGIAIYYVVINDLIHPVFAVFGAFDAVFLFLFAAFLLQAPRAGQATRTRGP